MPDFDNNGASVHYELVGSGPPLLMIAGSASDGASWRPLVPLLADRHRLILIDNRGSGRTKVDGPLALEDMVADSAALLDRLELDAVDVLGHSLGGALGIWLAAYHPQRVKRLVTLASGALGPKENLLLSDMARLYFTIPPADWFRLFYQWLFSAPFFANEANVATAAAASAAYPYRQSPGDFARQVAALDKTPPPIDFAQVTCPVLAIFAELDMLSPERAVRALHEAIANVTYSRIEGVAHSIHWEAPRAVAERVRGFLS
jgi:pimeloyl-ACP methyl ester carboxylesterase